MAIPKNPEEVDALMEFHARVEDLNLERGTLMRFLRARNLDLSNAEKMLRAYASWRKNNIYESALPGWKPPTQFLNQFQVFYCGVDEEKRPVFYIPFDHWLPSRPIFDEFTSFDVVLFTYKTFLTLYLDLIAETKFQQVVAILDFENMGFTKVFNEVQLWTGVQTLIDIWQLYEANFPETLHKAFFINTARAFMWGFNLMKPFAAKQTLDKISIFGPDETKWKPAIHNALPLDIIPEKFGGCAKLDYVYDLTYNGIMKKIQETNGNEDDKTNENEE